MFSKKKLKNVFDYDSIAIDINDRFISACENGDYPTVKRILNRIRDFNIDVVDSLGRSALRLAVENEHLEVVQALLAKSDNAKIREALLLSIFLGHSNIAESILKHPKYKIMSDKKLVNGDADSFWQAPSSDDAQFPPDITPLILAAQYNRTEIVQMLLAKGDRIIKPHDFDCKCNDCHNRFKFDSLRHAQSRLNSYRGLASESYVSLVSLDPILTAFELGRELRNLSMQEKFFKNEYLLLADNLSNYTVRLLSNIRGRDELEIVLNKTGKEGEEKYERLARLDLALKYKEKPFVAHPNCQQKLVEIWYTGLRPVSKMNNLFSLLLIILFAVLLPFLSVIYMIAPKTKVGKFIGQPLVKFIAHTMTYLAFISLIIISSLQFAEEEKRKPKFSELYPAFMTNYSNYASNSILTYRFNEQDFYLRSFFPSNVDIAITIWIIGMVWHEVKQIYSDGFKDYLLSINNVIDLSMMALYVASFALKYYTILMVRHEMSRIESSEFWRVIENLNGTDVTTQKQIFQTFYWLNEDRYYWISFDPINMAEALFALANLLSFSRICFLLPANQDLGPLQITLGQMINDIFKFVAIFVIIFLAFMFAMNNLFWYYTSNVRNSVEIINHLNPDNNSTLTKAEQAFGTLELTFGTIFWSIFGLSDRSFIDLKPFNNGITEFFGIILYGTFHIASVIVLLNMLIAMMTKSYENINEDSDVEWKFSRSILYMESIKPGATLAVPFNIVPTPKAMFYACKRIISLMFHKKHDDFDNRESSDSNFNMNRNHGEEKLTYRIVMERIVKRFLLHSQRESDDNHERDFEELKQDLQMIRYEMLNDLKRSKEESYQSVSLIHAGLSIIGEEVFKNSTPDNFSRFTEYKNYGNDIKEMYQDEFLDPMDIGDDENENSQQDPTLHSGKKGRILRRKFKLINVVNKALQTGGLPIIFQSTALDENREFGDKKDEEEIIEENRQIISLFRHERHSGRSFADRRVANDENYEIDKEKSHETEAKEMKEGPNDPIHHENNQASQEQNIEMSVCRNDEDKSGSSFDQEAVDSNQDKTNEEESQIQQEENRVMENDLESNLNMGEESNEVDEHNMNLTVHAEENQEQDNEYYQNEPINSSSTEIGEHSDQVPNMFVEENQTISEQTDGSNGFTHTETAAEDTSEHDTQKNDETNENKETKAQNNDSYYFF